MKKLYRKGTAVHPTPPPPPVSGDHLLSFLPQAIFILAVALPAEEKEVLAYLISCSSANFPDKPHKKSSLPAATGGSRGASTDHPPSFHCYCFRCYMSYWVRWDCSPNRRLIHDIIDAFEDGILKESRKEKGKKIKKRGSKNGKERFSLESEWSKKVPEPSFAGESFTFMDLSSSTEPRLASAAAPDTGDEEVGNNVAEDGLDKGPVRRFVSFLGERIWGHVWG